MPYTELPQILNHRLSDTHRTPVVAKLCTYPSSYSEPRATAVNDSTDQFWSSASPAHAHFVNRANTNPQHATPTETLCPQAETRHLYKRASTARHHPSRHTTQAHHTTRPGKARSAPGHLPLQVRVAGLQFCVAQVDLPHLRLHLVQPAGAAVVLVERERLVLTLPPQVLHARHAHLQRFAHAAELFLRVHLGRRLARERRGEVGHLLLEPRDASLQPRDLFPHLLQFCLHHMEMREHEEGRDARPDSPPPPTGAG